MTEIAALAAGGAAASPAVATYVIALGEDAAGWNEVAAAGGSTHAFSIVSGDAVQQLRDAFDVIVIGERSGDMCEYHLPPMQDGSEHDPSRIQVTFELEGGASRHVRRVDGASDCAALDYDGYYFDDVGAPTKVVLCPQICAHPWSLKPAILFGCARAP
jgi:hypothetical protein